MVVKFSGHEVIEMAIQIEQKGYDFYKVLMSRAKKENLKNLFHWLANEEKKHIAVIEELREEFAKIDVNSPYNWDEVALYFKALIDTQVFPDTSEGKNLREEMEDEIGAIHIAISLEKDNILYFQEIRDLVEKKEKEIINRLINEEKSHIMKLLETKRQIAGN
ncbi:MAG: ferritin family protein [Candidatus Hodarchaeota archaeon]